MDNNTPSNPLGQAYEQTIKTVKELIASKRYLDALTILKKAPETGETCRLISDVYLKLYNSGTADKEECKREWNLWHNKAVELKDPVSLIDEAQFYEKRDFEKAEKFYREAIAAGSLKACSLLGELYLDKNQIEKAKEAFKEGSEKGDGICALGLGILYERTQHDDQALELYKIAANRGIIRGAFRGGVLLNDRKEDPQGAIEYLKDYENCRNADIRDLLGFLYNKEMQWAKAINHYTAAIELGKKNSATLLGFVLLKNKNNQEALEIFRKAEAENLPGAQIGLYCYGIVSGDALMASQYKEAAKSSKIAFYIYEGAHVLRYLKHKDEENLLLTASAKLNYENARRFLVLNYIQQRNWDMAEYWALPYAKKGDKRYQYYVALTYLRGRNNIVHNGEWDKEAAKWAMASAMQGYESAFSLLREIKKEKEESTFSGWLKSLGKDIAFEVFKGVAGEWTEESIEGWIDGPLGETLGAAANEGLGMAVDAAKDSLSKKQ